MRIIFYIILVLFFIFIIYTFIIMAITNNMCEDKCIERGAIHYERVSNEELFSLNDKCICFFENKIESFNLMEK